MAEIWRLFIGSIAVFMPAVYMPPTAFIPLTGGMTILFGCIYTTLLDHPLLPLLRILASIPAIYCFIDFGWSPQHLPKPTWGTYLGMGTIGTYGIMRILDVCFIRLWDNDRPRWILKKSWPKWKAVAKRWPDSPGNRDKEPGVLPLPTTFKERLIYSFDLLTSQRGSSWYGDRVWEFAPASTATFSPPPRSEFLWDRFVSLVFLFFVLDTWDTVVKSRTYDYTTITPVTILPVHLQMAASIYTCIQTILALNLPYRVMSSLAVLLFNSSPSSWPPITGSSLTATSLSEFWLEWHHMFRRCFQRLTMGIVYIMPEDFARKHPRATRILRRGLFFTFSALLHLILLTTLPEGLYPLNPNVFLNRGTIKFFCSQPLGLAIEKAIIFPLTKGLPDSIRTFIRWVFTAAWLFWTSRWWVDVWVAIRMFAEEEKPVVLSPLRRLLYGKWMV
ncbi:hypothetical protein FRC03_010342 [Tulasnella sp. 419]|nr:hypothetical protein FRC03_010342 [Tulasnella sp. 419]